MFEEAREHIGSDAIKDARECLSAAYGTADLDGSINSHISDMAWGVLYARRGKHPMDLVELESPHYILGRTILCAVYGSDIRKLVDNAIDDQETRKQDMRFSQAVPTVNQIIESSGDEVLLQHLERLKRFFDGKDGVKMRRDMNTVAEHSTMLGRSLREHTGEYAKLRAA